jgi:hypothetical protein
MLEVTHQDISDELERARAKFPMPNPTFVALVEEVGELAKALLTCKAGDTNLSIRVYEEAIQVATMAVRVLEEGDRDYPAFDPKLIAPEWRYRRLEK